MPFTLTTKLCSTNVLELSVTPLYRAYFTQLSHFICLLTFPDGMPKLSFNKICETFVKLLGMQNLSVLTSPPARLFTQLFYAGS